jgi:hypothetical protein
MDLAAERTLSRRSGADSVVVRAHNERDAVGSQINRVSSGALMCHHPRLEFHDELERLTRVWSQSPAARVHENSIVAAQGPELLIHMVGSRRAGG